MEIPKEFKGRYFYHFTHVDNIESIIKHGILSTNEKALMQIGHVDLANENIQMRRSNMNVTCKPYGKIHDYVPFYFATVNPMLLSVLNRKNIDQPLVVFIAISIEKLLNDNVVFTNASANTTIPPKFYNDPKHLENLSWELIDSRKWGTSNNDERHARMAEVLIYNKVPIEYIDSYIVYNQVSKKRIEDIYTRNGLKAPNILFQSIQSKFYYTKFFMQNREKETLITGPWHLNYRFTNLVKEIIEDRKKQSTKKCTFKNVEQALINLKNNFCEIKELEGIYKLKTDNKVHSDNVSDHTLKVVANVSKNEYYNKLSDGDKKLVEFAAYLHDIGKGPKTKWKDGIQPAYADHPADAIPLLKRILSEEFDSLSEYEIRKISILVVYHDIIGDILKDNIGRSEKELLKLNLDESELYMLICIGLADIASLNIFWQLTIEEKLPNFTRRMLKEINCNVGV